MKIKVWRNLLHSWYRFCFPIINRFFHTLFKINQCFKSNGLLQFFNIRVSFEYISCPNIKKFRFNIQYGFTIDSILVGETLKIYYSDKRDHFAIHNQHSLFRSRIHLIATWARHCEPWSTHCSDFHWIRSTEIWQISGKKSPTPD